MLRGQRGVVVMLTLAACGASRALAGDGDETGTGTSTSGEDETEAETETETDEDTGQTKPDIFPIPDMGTPGGACSDLPSPDPEGPAFAWTEIWTPAQFSGATPRKLVTDADDGIYVTGSYWTNDSFDNMFLARFHPEGTFHWQEGFPSADQGSDEGYAIALANDGDLILAGTGAFEPNMSTAWLARYDFGGEIVWIRDLMQPIDPVAWDLVVDYDGTIYAAGGGVIGSTLRVGSYDSDGAEGWTHTVSPPGDTENLARGIAITSTDDIVAVGSLANGSMYVGKLAVDGTPVWELEVLEDGAEWMKGFEVATHFDGSIYVGAVLERDAWVGRFGPEGELLWSDREGIFGGWDYVHGLAALPDGVLVIGELSDPQEDRVIWLRRYRDDGEILWDHRVSGAMHYLDRGRAVTIDSCGAAVALGEIAEDNASGEVWLARFVP